MTKSLIIIISYLFIALPSTQGIFGQDSTELKGIIVDYETEQTLPGVKVEAYIGKVLLDSTYSDLENGSFTLTTKNTTDKIIFSFIAYYPIIIENIKNLEGNELDLGTIKLFEMSLACTRYISRKAEREDKKQSRREFAKLKKGIEINSGSGNYKMRLKKENGIYAFYIDFDELKNK